MADVISLDSDEDENQSKQPIQSTQISGSAAQEPPKIRPGPLSAKLKQIQLSNGRISPNLVNNMVGDEGESSSVISARETLAEAPATRTPAVATISPRYSTDDIDTSGGPVTRSNQKLELAKLMDKNSKFLADFDPETSIRERRKLVRKSYTENTKVMGKTGNTIYDEKGIHRGTSLDLCDCLDTGCVGCHFPCPSCSSFKCGPTCRVNRRYMYECIEYDGKDQIKKNPILNNYI